MVTRLDRLARSTLHLRQIAHELERKRVNLHVLDQPIDPNDATGRLLFHMLGAIEQFETEIRAERQMKGIEKAKARGVRFGPKKRPTDAQTAELQKRRAQGETNQSPHAGLWDLEGQCVSLPVNKRRSPDAGNVSRQAGSLRSHHSQGNPPLKAACHGARQQGQHQAQNLSNLGSRRHCLTAVSGGGPAAALGGRQSAASIMWSPISSPMPIMPCERPLRPVT